MKSKIVPEDLMEKYLSTHKADHLFDERDPTFDLWIRLLEAVAKEMKK